MKTDMALQNDVIAELKSDPAVDHAHIGVSACNGVVSLSGSVRTLPEKLAAERAARRVLGVMAIAEGIKVDHPATDAPSDAEIARRILAIFAWDAIVPQGVIDVKVENGHVTLSGHVDWFYQSDAAHKAASRVVGVTAISNQIDIRNMPSSDDLRDRITAAFQRIADLDADRINIVIEGGFVRLGGRVDHWHEREIAERAAWAAPGVTRIENNILVGC